MREKRFDRGAWLTLVLALFILLFGISIPIIQFNLPTDGWLTTMAPNSADNIVYTADLLGVNTGLQINDLLIAVEGVPVFQLEPVAIPTDRLEAGEVITLTVQRGGDQLQVNVTMAHWTLKAIAAYNLGKAGSWLTGLTGLALLVVGFYVFLNRPRYPAAQALLVLNTVITLMFLLWGLVPNSIANVIVPAIPLYSDISYALVFSLLFPPALIRFGLVFPRLKRSIERHPPLQFFPYAVGLVVFTANQISGWPMGACYCLDVSSPAVDRYPVSAQRLDRSRTRSAAPRSSGASWGQC